MSKQEQLTVVLHTADKKQEVKVDKNTYFGLPRVLSKDKTFLGWNEYSALTYGYMHYSAHRSAELYAIFTTKPAYVIESCFRGDKDDYVGARSQFRRYIVDVYLENAVANNGSFSLETPGNFLYYIGAVPVGEMDVTVQDTTNIRGDVIKNAAYNGYAQFTTTNVAVHWESATPVDATKNRVHIARLMFAFSRWGMGYNEIERRTSDDIVCCNWNEHAFAGGEEALVSANFYNGIIPEEKHGSVSDDKNVTTLYSENECTLSKKENVLARFAVLADSHVGERYQWKDYEWLYGVYAHLGRTHQQTPLDFVVQLGDNIDDGYERSYQADYKLYLETVQKLKICDAENPIEYRRTGTVPHYELQGNHDTSMDTRFFRQKLWYTQNEQGEKVAFIAFFVEYGGYPAVTYAIKGDYESYRAYGVLSNETVAFVEQSIVEAVSANAKHIVLLSHFGIAPDLISPVLPETGFGKIENLCKKYGIKLYFSGHEHNVPYSLRKCGELYNYDAAMTHDKYAVVELYATQAVVRVYDTHDNTLHRIDVIEI